ncbi:hypothetical protein ACFLKB_13065 [Clostridium sp. FAM 1755]
MLSGKLYLRLLEIDQSAHVRLEQLMLQMMKVAGITE